MRSSLVWSLLATFLIVGCGDDDPSGNNNGNQNQGTCGDGVVNVSEECDEGAANSDLAPDACRSDCRLARCGDGVVDTGEPCDDGNASDEDDCLNTCQWNVCGDGFVNQTTVDGTPVERCDDGNTEDDLVCRGDCGQDMTLCGDGVTDPGETCDDGVLNSDTEQDACRTSCQVAHCGDGAQDDGEECDCGMDPNALPFECTAVNGGQGANCSATCELLPICGDGIEVNPEECDDGPANSDTLPNACRTDCRVYWCGDGVADISEFCDGADLDATLCEDLPGFTGGTLACTSACDFDTSGCTNN